jgi:hypothetical protein
MIDIVAYSFTGRDGGFWNTATKSTKISIKSLDT